MKRLALTLALCLIAPLAQAQSAMASYTAYIGNQDLYNSNGLRLSEPWQVLRQDRANYHRFNVRQAGDDWDPLFSNANNRALLEQAIQNSYISPEFRSMIMSGGATVHVDVYGNNGRIQTVSVTVFN
jgi:hypothetical protein